jgi:hypothetical protein
MVGRFYRCCALPSSFACPGPPDPELCYQNQGGTPSEFLIDLLFAYNEEIPHSFQTSKQIGRKTERESGGGWVVGFTCLGQL